MRRQWVLPFGVVAAMVVLTPTAFGTRSTPSALGWTAILIGAICLLMLLALVEHLTPPSDRTDADAGEATAPGAPRPSAGAVATASGPARASGEIPPDERVSSSRS
ncbi:hypothetical protein ABZ281_02045 [Streptomyces sp. NPDC006265]|uniref:hypothetical protein n=1 Tax=Streptomyces sp. NPDC006265 TaxID=3156740 RepID=UPI0033B548D1